MTDQPRKRITIDAPDGSTILAARHLDATEGRVQIGSTVDTSTRSAITRVLGYIAKAHGSASLLASTAPLAAGLPQVQGRCPACGRTSLFLADGGYVTCSIIDCPNPSAADELLHGDAQDQLARALGRERAARVIAHTLHAHGHTLAAVQSMTDEQLLAVPGIQETSLALIRARIPAPAVTEATEPATITDPEWLRQQYATAMLRVVEPFREIVRPEVFRIINELATAVLAVRDRHVEQLRQRLELADIGLDEPAPAQDGGEARTTPDNSAASEDAADNPLREQYAAAVECAIGLNVDCGGTEGVHRVRDAVLAVRDEQLEELADRHRRLGIELEHWQTVITHELRTDRDQLAATHIRDQSALAQIRLHIAAHRPRLQLADPILLAKVEAVLRQVGELEAAGGS